MRKIRKLYRIACIAIGKKKVHMILSLAIAGIALIAYKNQFDINQTIGELKGIFQNIPQ